MGNNSTKKKVPPTVEPEIIVPETDDPFPDIQNSKGESSESTYYSSQIEQTPRLIKKNKIDQFVNDLKGLQELYIKYGDVKLIPGREIFFLCLEDELSDMDLKDLRTFLGRELINLFPYSPSKEELIDWLARYLESE